MIGRRSWDFIQNITVFADMHLSPTFLSGYEIPQDESGGLAVEPSGQFIATHARLAQKLFGCVRSEPLILQMHGDAYRKREIARDAACLSRRVAFRAVQFERQTNNHCLSVKAVSQIRDLTEQFFPIRAIERRQRLSRQLQLVADGDADALRPQVEREQAAFNVKRLHAVVDVGKL